MRLIGMILTAIMMNIIALDNSRADEDKLGFDAYGISYLIEEKRVEELFYVMLEAFGYINKVELRYRGRATRSILAISMDNIFRNGNFNLEKLNEFDREIRSILEMIETGEEQCLVTGFKTREQSADGISVENWKTVVVFSNRGNKVEEQIKCLYIGVLVSFGADHKDIEALSRLSSRVLAKKIIDLDF